MLKLWVAAVDPLKFVDDPRVADSLRAVVATILGIARSLVGMIFLKLEGPFRRLQSGSRALAVAAFDAWGDEASVRQMAQRMSAEPISSLELAVDSQLAGTGVQGAMGVTAVEATPATFAKAENGTVSVLEFRPVQDDDPSTTTLWQTPEEWDYSFDEPPSTPDATEGTNTTIRLQQEVHEAPVSGSFSRLGVGTTSTAAVALLHWIVC